MPSPNKKVLHSYVSPEEEEAIKALAERFGLSVSTYLSRVALGQVVKPKTDQQVFLALLKANADLGRLGGLFKLAITERKTANKQTIELRELLRKIETSQKQLLVICRNVAESFKGKRK